MSCVYLLLVPGICLSEELDCRGAKLFFQMLNVKYFPAKDSLSSFLAGL